MSSFKDSYLAYAFLAQKFASSAIVNNLYNLLNLEKVFHLEQFYFMDTLMKRLQGTIMGPSKHSQCILFKIWMEPYYWSKKHTVLFVIVFQYILCKLWKEKQPYYLWKKLTFYLLLFFNIYCLIYRRKSSRIIDEKVTFLLFISICFMGRQASLTCSIGRYFLQLRIERSAVKKKGSNWNITVNQL